MVQGKENNQFVFTTMNADEAGNEIKDMIYKHSKCKSMHVLNCSMQKRLSLHLLSDFLSPSYCPQYLSYIDIMIYVHWALYVSEMMLCWLQ